jgi:hypothetical protein
MSQYAYAFLNESEQDMGGGLKQVTFRCSFNDTVTGTCNPMEYVSCPISVTDPASTVATVKTAVVAIGVSLGYTTLTTASVSLPAYGGITGTTTIGYVKSAGGNGTLVFNNGVLISST